MSTKFKSLRFNLKPLAIVVTCCFSFNAQANPIGAQVVNGAAAINQSGNTLTVTNSPNAIINWQGFSINQNETTHFIQQSAASSVLNRVVGSDPSQLLGALTSNGKVFLINPSGILVGQGARIDVAGLVASTLNISNTDFFAGKLNFSPLTLAGEGQGERVVNAGHITTPEGGTVYLIAPQVENSGLITTPKGETILAAGNTVQLIDTATPGVTVQVTGRDNNATNLGQILADSGRIGVVGAVVRNSGALSANSLVSEGGRVFLKASKDTYVEGNGNIEARGTQGGSVDVLGNRVAITDNSSIDVSGQNRGGTVRVGGDYQGKNPDIQNAAITYFGPNASIKADGGVPSPSGGGGLGWGNGGKVIVWADDITRAYGSISARGGPQGGNGGFVETSGHRYLDFQGRVDTRAPQGLAGTLLLDPVDITLDNSTDNLSGGTLGGGFFSGATGNSILTWNTINTQAGSLEIRTNSVPTGGFGDININGSGVVSGPTTLTLLATNNINIANGVSVSGAGDFNLVAGWNNTGWAVSPSAGGNIIFGPGSSLSTPGNIWLNAGNAVSQDPSAAITANTLTLGNTNGFSIPAGVSLPGTNMVGTLAAIVTNGPGGFTFSNGQTLAIGTGSFAINGINTSGNPNPVTITTIAGGITVSQNISSGGSVTLDAVAGGIAGAGQIIANTIALQSTGGTGNIGTSLLAPLTTSSIGGAGNANISIGFNATGPGAVYLAHTGDATLQQVFTTGAATPVNISATNNLIATNINAGAADLNLAAGNLLSVPALTSLSGANISLSGNLIDIIAVGNPASINAGGGVAWLHPSTSGRPIDLGAKAGLPNTLELSTNELNTVTAGTLRVGNVAAGGLNISAAIAPASTAVLSLESGGVVTQALAGTITASKLAVKSTGNVALNTAPNNVGALAGSITGTGSEYFHFQNSGNLIIDTVDGVAGISIANFPGYTPGSANGVIALQAGSNISQTATGNLGGAAVWANSTGGSVNLTTATGGNATGILAGSAYSGFSYKSSNTIALKNVDVHSGISTTMAGDIVLVGPGFFNSLATPFTVATGGRWLVYTASPSVVTKGVLTSNFRHYNATFLSYPVPAEAGNGFIYASAPGALSVDTKLVSGTASNTYGTAPTATFGYMIANPTIADNEDLLLIGGTPIFTPTISSTTPAGPYTVSYMSGLTSAAGYSFIPGIGLSYTVDPLPIIVSNAIVLSGSKVYDGTPTFSTGQMSISNIVSGDVVSLSAGTANTADQNVGINKPFVSFNGLALTGASAANYTLAGISGFGTITPRLVTFTVDPGQGKTYGQFDPTYISFNDNAGALQVVAGDILNGVLTRVAGENAGVYPIGQGSLTSANNPNYDITFVSDVFTINPALLQVVANHQTKVFGAADPPQSIVLNGLIQNPDLGIDDVAAAQAGTLMSGTLSREAGEAVGGGSTNGEYAFELGTLSAGGNYTINSFISNTLAITKPVDAVLDPLVTAPPKVDDIIFPAGNGAPPPPGSAGGTGGPEKGASDNGNDDDPFKGKKKGSTTEGDGNGKDGNGNKNTKPGAC